jgi:serine/threonine protein kinase
MVVKNRKDSCPFCGQSHDPEALVCPMTGLSLRFADPEKAVGQVIGSKYRLDRLIGKGGMGTVYEATNIQLDKKVAIKTLLPESSRIDQVTERFKREARSAASIGHENIVDIYDLDTTEEGVIYIVMELLSGYDLAEALKGGACIPVHRAASIGVQTARALGAAHERGLIHRDLKPENIFLIQRKSGEIVKIVDFGIAMIKEHGSLSRLTTDGILLGTPYYMSPEQARGVKELDHRVDVYALGAVLFESLTGTVLFSGETYLEVISKHQIEAVPLLCERKKDLIVPDEFETTIMKMLEKDPARRPSSMDEVEKVLLPFSCETASRPPSLSEKFEEFSETVADMQSLQLQKERLHTTPVEWEGDKKSKKLLKTRSLAIALVILFIFIFSAAAAILFLDHKPKNRSQAAGGIPISSAEIKSNIAEARKETVTIKIAASPAEASITFDGKLLEENPAAVTVKASSRKANITVEAAGYKPQTREVQLDKDDSIAVALEIEKTKPVVVIKEVPVAQPVQESKQQGAKKGKREIKVSEESPYKK